MDDKTRLEPNRLTLAVGLALAVASLVLAAPLNDAWAAELPTPTAGATYGPYSHTLRHGLDGNGNRTTTVDAAGVLTNQTFDAFNRLIRITNAEGTTIYTWYPNDVLETITRADGTRSFYTYDRAKRITALTHSRDGAVTLGFTYRYDRNGNRIEQIRTQSAMSGQAGSIRTTAYTYDNDDRLTATEIRHQPQTTISPDELTEWTLDEVGNRLSERVTRLSDNTVTSNKAYTYNPRDQLLVMEDSVNNLRVTYGYDGNGNRTSRTVARNGESPQGTRYVFDARDLLVGVYPEPPNASNAPSVRYVYDADGRRIERIEIPAAGSPSHVTLFIYNGSSLLHEAEPVSAAASGIRLTDTYRRGAKLDRHILYPGVGSPSLRSYQLDALDSPVAMTDSTGATVNRTLFDAWGNVLEQVANGSIQTPWALPAYNPDFTGQSALLSHDGQRIGFTGYEKDEVTGLYYAGERYYDPLVGNFNAMDSWSGDPQHPITLNKYLYANGNPLTFTDRTGRYGEAGHYYTTYYIALRTGYSSEAAQKLAFYSQLPDEVDRLDAVGVQADFIGGTFGATLARSLGMIGAPNPSPSVERDPVQTNLHVLDNQHGPEATARTLRALSKVDGDLATTGVLIHPLGDSFSHRQADGITFPPGFGHAPKGHDPDVIQRDPEQYLAYVETVANELATMRGVTADETAQLASLIRNELAEVASIAIVPQADTTLPEWKASGWMQSPPGPVTTAMASVHRQTKPRSNELLEKLSVEMLRKKLGQLDANLDYAPDLLPEGVDAQAKFFPNAWEARTLPEAVADFQNRGGGGVDGAEAGSAVNRAMLLMEAEKQRDAGRASLVGENPSGGVRKEFQR